MLQLVRWQKQEKLVCTCLITYTSAKPNFILFIIYLIIKMYKDYPDSTILFNPHTDLQKKLTLPEFLGSSRPQKLYDLV